MGTDEEETSCSPLAGCCLVCAMSRSAWWLWSTARQCRSALWRPPSATAMSRASCFSAQYNSMQARRRHSSSSASTGDPVMITVAITGDVADKVRVCNVPLSVQEQVESIHECHEAGAHMCHLHVRDQTDSRCSWKPELYEAVLEGVDKHCPGMIMQFSTGNYAPSPAARSACLQLHPDMASLTCGSVNFRFSRPGQDLSAARVFVNPHEEIEHLAQTMQSSSVKPDIAVFDLSMIYSTAQLFERGLITPPFRFMYVLGGHMALPAEKEVLQFLVS